MSATAEPSFSGIVVEAERIVSEAWRRERPRLWRRHAVIYTAAIAVLSTICAALAAGIEGVLH